MEGGQHYGDCGHPLPSTIAWVSGGGLFVKSRVLDRRLAEAIALERQPVRVVHQPIQNGVGNGRVGDGFVPVLDRQLAGHKGAAATMPVIDDLQQITALARRQAGKPPVVQDQQFDTGITFNSRV